jgi:hypothetical protein
MKCCNPRFLNELEDVLKVRGRTAKTEFIVLCGCNAGIGNWQSCHTRGTVFIGQEVSFVSQMAKNASDYALVSKEAVPDL